MKSHFSKIFKSSYKIIFNPLLHVSFFKINKHMMNGTIKFKYKNFHSSLTFFTSHSIKFSLFHVSIISHNDLYICIQNLAEYQTYLL